MPKKNKRAFIVHYLQARKALIHASNPKEALAFFEKGEVAAKNDKVSLSEDPVVTGIEADGRVWIVTSTGDIEL